MEITLFYIPFATQEEASKVAECMLAKRMIACANIVQSHSAYHWNNEMVNGQEIILLAKTIQENIPAVNAYIEKEHPYEIPLIAHYPMNVNKKYYDWIKKQLLQ